MAKVVGEVAIGVTADIGPLIRETVRAKAVMSGFNGAMQRMGGGMGKLASVTGNLGAKLSLVTAALAGVTAAAMALTRNAAAMGDAIGDGAKAAGMSTTAFQEYRFAIKEAADMTDDEFASAMVKLNKSLGEAREGSKSAIAAFKRIGISQADIASGAVTSEAALAAFVRKMEETKDPATAAAMAADLFGKSGASLGAALSGVPGQVGALVDRARDLGVVMGPEAVKAAGQFDQKMKELGTQFEVVKMKIAEVLLPVIVNQLIPALQDKIIPAVLAVVDKIGEWATAFSQLDPAIQDVVLAVTGAFAVGGPVLLAIAGVASALSALVLGPAAPFVLLGLAIAGIIAVWPEFGTKAKDAFATLGGAVVGAIELVGLLIEKIGAAEEGFLRLFRASAQGTGAVNDAMRQNAIEFGYIEPDGGRDRQGNTGAGRLPDGGSNSRTGASLIDGTVDGMNMRLAERLPEVQAAAQLVTDTFKAQLGVQSPSTVFAEIGGFIGQGLANGIASTQGIVANAVGTMGAGAVAANDAMVNDILGGLNTLFGESKQVGAGLALISTMIGAAKELQKGTFGFASAARVIAQGMGFVKAIKGAKKGGEGGGGMSGGGGAAVAQQPTTTMQFTFQNDPFGFGESFARQMVAQLNKAQQSGSRIIGVIG